MRKYIKAHDGMLLANHGALTVGGDLFAAYYKMETIEHFAKISLVARLLGRENLLVARGSRRGCRSCAAPTASRRRRRFAPTRPPTTRRGRATCQVVQAPAGGGRRLVPERAPRHARQRRDGEAEIRLTYRELSALIEEAIRACARNANRNC